MYKRISFVKKILLMVLLGSVIPAEAGIPANALFATLTQSGQAVGLLFSSFSFVPNAIVSPLLDLLPYKEWAFLCLAAFAAERYGINQYAAQKEKRELEELVKKNEAQVMLNAQILEEAREQLAQLASASKLPYILVLLAANAVQANPNDINAAYKHMWVSLELAFKQAVSNDNNEMAYFLQSLFKIIQDDSKNIKELLKKIQVIYLADLEQQRKK